MSHDRQHPVDRTRFQDALAHGLEGQLQQPPGPCPDAETLAAFSEDSLSASDRQEVESHLAACAGCQAHIAALIRTEGIEHDINRPVTSWWLDWRWLAPVATTAVVLLAVWAVDPTTVRDSGTEMERAASDVRLPAQGQASRAEADATPALEEVAAPDPPVEAISGDASAALSEAGLADAPVPAAQAERRLNELTRSVNTASPLRNRTSDQAGGLVTIASYETALWRVTEDGGLVHSADGGVTWTRQLASAGPELTAGSAPSGSVCWLVGRDGTILRTVDGGASWARIEAPLPSDVVGVTATDGQTVVVEFGDGQIFGSTDGGSTWTRR